MSDLFERTFVLNLKRRPDRLKQFRDEMKKGWPFAYPEVFEAIDGKLCPCPPHFHQGSAVWGCFQSHRQMLERALRDGNQSLLILEDDAVLCEGFREKALKFAADVPDDWEFLWLGGQHMKPPIKVKPGIVQATHIDRMHAYAVRGRGLVELYKYWSEWHSGHCDWALSQWVSQFKTYCAYPWIVGQRAGTSDINIPMKQDEFFSAFTVGVPADFALPVKPNGRNHLVYFIWPKKGNGTWQWNVNEMLKEHRIDLFDGTRSIAIMQQNPAVDKNTKQPIDTTPTDSVEAVQAMFKGHRIDNWIIGYNNPKLGEVEAFKRLLATLPKTGRTFYGHAKGVKYPTNHLRPWTESMYKMNLDLPHRAWNAMRESMSAGCFVQDISAYTKADFNWAYAGTFFWFRNDVLYRPQAENEIIQDYWGVEAWLGHMLPKETGHNLTPIEHGPIHWPSEMEKTGAWVNQQMSDTIPIYINARNLLSTLEPMVEYLLKIPNAMPIIVDNASTYEPLIEYYEKRCPVRVIRSAVNGGKFGWIPYLLDHQALGFKKYVVTDSDLNLEGIPLDVLDVLSRGLDEHPDALKVGLSLDLTSIPDAYHKSRDVKVWERQFWRKQEGQFWHAGIDTTFAMRRAADPIDRGTVERHLRADRPYTAIHWPWQWSPEVIQSNPEVQYYIKTAEGPGLHWTTILKNSLK